METPRTPDALAALIAVNVTPLAGILLLEWSPGAVLISYFVDTFLGFGALVLLVMIHVTGDEHDRPISGWKGWVKAAIGLGVLGAIMALPLSLPLWMTLGDDPGTWALFSDRGFLGALAVQGLMSALAIARMHRQLKTRSDDDRVLARRGLFLAARWITLFVAMVTGFIALLGPTIGGFILVAIYATASVYFELFPERAERFVRGNEAKPVTFEGDLESRAAADNHRSGSRGPSQPKDSTSAPAATKSDRRT
jgi:hypothetical protein